MGLKELFTSSKTETSQNPQQTPIVTGASYASKGARDAGLCEGSPKALQPNLQAIYVRLTRFIQQNQKEQDERKNKVRMEISGLEANVKNIDVKIKAEKDKLDFEGNKIEKTKKEITEIKENPGIVSGDSFAKVSFWIGFVIICVLTLYLFVFYSSAAYSAFFKNFTPDDNNVAQAIFDAQAIEKAWNDGVTELIFILAIPAVFLGLGFLIYKFSAGKGFSNNLKTGGLLFVTFVFDFIIAYEIVEKIYDLKRVGTFEPMPDMTIGMAIERVNFWLIIFAGFVVYIIWGLVFSFVMQEYEKMNKVRYAIKIKEQNLVDYKAECKKLKAQLLNLETEKNTIQGEIDKLKIQIESCIIYFDDVREGLNNYYSGWINYMKTSGASQDQIEECDQIKNQFFSTILKSFTTK